MRLGSSLWALFVASVKMFVRNRAAVFFSLFLPLIIMLIFGVLNFEGSTEMDARHRRRGGQRGERGLIEALGEYDYLDHHDRIAHRRARRARGRRARTSSSSSRPDWSVPAPGAESGLVAYASNDGSRAGPGRPGPAPAGRRAGHVRAGRRWGAIRPRAAGDLRVGRVARPRLHRLPRARHRRA